jgi:hypothetical protein
MTYSKLTCLVALCGGLLAACTDDIDEQFDCIAICDRYAECADEDYDVDDCADRCETNADQDEAFGDKADACEACIDDRSCVEAAFPCASECVGIVP